MAIVEKTPAIDPGVLADLEAVCNTKGIVLQTIYPFIKSIASLP
jgi:hypothetical protein